MMAEETKAQGSEKYPPARITPLEIEEGRVPSTEGRGPAKPAEKTTCQRHRGKFVCLGITLALLAAGGIVAAVYWPKMPKFTLYSESQINIDLLGTNTAKLMVQIENPNRFAISFSDLEAKIFDNNNVFVGTVSRKERMMVPARSTEMMTATGEFPTSIELGLMGINCLANDLKTTVRIESTQMINFLNRKYKYTTSVRDTVPCVARNVGGGGGGAAPAAGGAGGGAPAPGAAGGDTPAVQQIGNAINDGINQIFGGGGGGGGAAPAPPAPPAPPAN